MRRGRSNRGFVLVFALWVLTFLTVIAVSVAAGVRQKILLIKRLDERRRVLSMQQAGVHVAIAHIRNVWGEGNGLYSGKLKEKLHNDTGSDLRDIQLNGDNVRVIAPSEDNTSTAFGVIDEERKINLNTASLSVLQELISRVLGVRIEAARALAQSVYDWSRSGSGELIGFYSDEYYSNLKYPYPKKDIAYDALDELLLVKGIDKEIFEKLKKYTTVWGDGQVNINTASKVVLESLGLSSELADKVIDARRGKDGVEATVDDYVFIRPFDIAIELGALKTLEPQEIKAIDFLNAQNLLGTNSFYFSIMTEGYLRNEVKSPSVNVIYSVKDNRIVYWKEK